MPFYLTWILVLIADQLTKLIVRLHLPEGETVFFWGLELTHYENAGMAFSLFQGYARLFAAVAVIFVIGILYFRKHEPKRGALVDVGLGFLAGGAIGNAIDRIVFGRVTDFLVSPSGKGILNLADQAINVGIVLLAMGGVIHYVAGKARARARQGKG